MGKAVRDMAEVKENGGAHISSTTAFILYAVLLTAGYVFATIFPVAPFEIYAYAFSAGVAAYWGKRLIQKSEKYSGSGGGAIRNGLNVDPQQPIGD